MSTEFSLQQTCRTCCNTNENEVMIPFFYHDQPDIISPLHLIEQLGFINLKVNRKFSFSNSMNQNSWGFSLPQTMQ